MPRRISREARRNQVVDCALALLADAPVDRITTRQVAGELGISQLALLRQFRSRDEIFEAVEQRARDELERLAAEVLERRLPPLAAIAALIGSLVAHASLHPGMGRLLCGEVAKDAAVAHHGRTTPLVSLQHALAAELVFRAQRAGEVAPSVDPSRAASRLMASLQGLLDQWQLSGRELPLASEADAVLASWRADLGAGRPARSPGDAPDGIIPASHGDRPALVGLDVRPLTEAGGEPLAVILAALRNLPDDGVLKVLARRRPTALLGLLAADDRRTRCRELEPGCWDVEILGPRAATPEDLRDLEAPGPLERILLATAELAMGESYAARTPRHPRMLLPRLAERGLAFEVHDEPDGSALVHVSRPA